MKNDKVSLRIYLFSLLLGIENSSDAGIVECSFVWKKEFPCFRLLRFHLALHLFRMIKILGLKNEGAMPYRAGIYSREECARGWILCR